MDAQELKTKLISSIEQTLTHLLPNGKVKAGRYHVGNINGDPGETLQVEIQGQKAGLWLDRANPTADKGDILDLWMRVKGSPSFVEALSEIRRYLGISEVKRIAPVKPQGFGGNPVNPLSGTDVYEYLLERGILPDTMQTYRLRRHPTEPAIAYRFYTHDGSPAYCKYESIHRDEKGKKKIWSTTPYPTLWGWWRVTPNDRSIVICEGEKDAMTVYQLETGLPVLSLPNGTGGFGWIDNDYDRLQSFETIYVITDMDEPGDNAYEEIAKRLGITRVMRIPVPAGYKDPNELWCDGEDSLLNWHQWLKDGYYFVPQSIRTPLEYLKRAKELRAKHMRQAEKNDFIFPSIPTAYRDGETSLISGEPGHGKSDFLYQSHLHEMKIGHQVFVCSMEIEPAKMLNIMAQQMTGKFPSDTELERCLEWLNERMVFHTGVSTKDPEAQVSAKELFEEMLYGFKRFGSKRFVIDSLHFFVSKDDYEAQDKFTKDLQKFDLTHGTHTALVAHSNIKGRKDGTIPGRHDVEGSGGLIKPIDNGFTIFRNEAKQTEIEEAKTDSEREDAMKKCDGILKCWKQRESGEHFQRKLWFDKKSRTFRTEYEEEPQPICPELADEPPPETKEQMF